VGYAIIVGMNERWRLKAACLGAEPDVFFPTARRHTTHTWKAARDYCDRCPVRRQCLDLAMRQQAAEDRWGMFGGTTPSERRRMRRVSS
jgi:WhiB family transcriptional regulator, redox-sensing transcriptional regulator